MKRLVKKRESIGMDLTPLIDVVFLLLIFFIVASEFKKEEHVLDLLLPGASSTKEVTKQKEVVIEVSETAWACNARNVTLEEMRSDLAEVDKEAPLTVRIDKAVPYERVVRLLDLLKELKLKNLMLVTQGGASS
jgi:biopolymer transport protein ExbD